MCRSSILLSILLIICIPLKSLDAPHYTIDFFDLGQKTNQSTGIIVIAYNRPHYLKQVLDALEKTPEAASIQFIFMLDGGPYATQKENKQLIENAAIKNKYVVSRSSQYGSGRSVIDARRFMFEWCNFDRIILIEDDVVVSPEYFTLVLALHDWAVKNYDNVGTVQCFNKCNMAVNEKIEHLDHVKEVFGGFYGYCLDKKVYFAIKPMIDEHEKKHLIDISATGSNGAMIAEWFMHYMEVPNEGTDKQRKFISKIRYKKLFSTIAHSIKRRFARKRRDGQDFETRLALYVNGYVKIATIVNRALYIGEKGRHHTSEKFEKMGYATMTLQEYVDDMDRKEFCVATNVDRKRSV